MTNEMTEAGLAVHYEDSRDVSDFDLEHPEPVTVRRDVTISVRFSEEEIAELRAKADQAGGKVTSVIRAAALDAANPVDRSTLTRLAQDLERRAHDLARLVARGVA